MELVKKKIQILEMADFPREIIPSAFPLAHVSNIIKLENTRNSIYR